MESDSGALIRFAVNGQRFELSRSDVVNCLADVAPDTIRKHAVKVNGTWFPVIQAFEAATGIPRSEFMSHTARRHLAALGFEVAGSVESRTAPEAFRATDASPSLRMSRGNEKHRNLAAEWHTEASVRASLVTRWRQRDGGSFRWLTQPPRSTASTSSPPATARRSASR